MLTLYSWYRARFVTARVRLPSLYIRQVYHTRGKSQASYSFTLACVLCLGLSGIVGRGMGVLTIPAIPDILVLWGWTYEQHMRCQKPDRLYEVLIETHSKSGDVVYDPCAGSLVTLRAAYETNRRYCCVEKNKEYIDAGLKFSTPHLLPWHS